MNTEKVVRDLLAAWEAHDLNKTVTLLANNFKMTGTTSKAVNKETFLMFQRVHNEAFPDWSFNVSQIKAQDDEVYIAFRIKATHSGVYDVSKLGISIPPIQPTGKRRSWPRESMTCTVKHGKINHIKVEIGPGGGLMGTLAWLGVKLPAGEM